MTTLRTRVTRNLPLPASGRIGAYTRIVVVGASREKALVYVVSHRGG